MQPSEFYQSILDSITDRDERHLFVILSEHVGQPMSRSDLIQEFFGVRVRPEELANNPHDRMIRKIIENLRNRDYPIVSSSGEAGYMLTDDQDAIDACVAEERARVRKIEEKITHMQRSRKLAHDLHLWREGAELPVQLKFI